MIVAFTTPAMGHVKPMMPLLKGLVTRGQPVACFGHGSFEEVIRSSGAAFVPYPEVRYDVERPDFNLVRMAADLLDASRAILPSVLPRVAAMRPRLIVQDFMSVWGSRVGTALGIPRVHTIPTIVFDPAAIRAMCREDGVAKLAGDVARGIGPLLAALARTGFAVSPNEAFGLAGSWRRLAPPVHELVLNMREVHALDAGVPRTFVGPAVDIRRSFAPSGLPPDYALITFGTLSNTSTERFAAALRAAFMTGLPAVVQSGRKVDVARLRALAASLERERPGWWARVVEHVPDLEPLVRDAALVIHHAGTGSTWETARYRKPALFVPTIADQMVFASRLERLGIGVRLPRGSETDAGAMALALARVQALTPPWEEVEAMQARAGGAERAVDIVLAALEAAP